ncbi:hypothetical protein [Cyanobium sp. FACHB-13342]|uniref:hypothetical protein n=1 Tax=Cyanobium sp. FACHB-13342 TaxID=2692793 RepID=UPI001681BA85|nr:hypothetical protein [Cyanobium sp. FACHB-13342]MBD2422481.1 hypothetical protein [Cyanobium sp. FACHB-13342]
MGGKQLGFSDYELTTAKKQTKREKFLAFQKSRLRGLAKKRCKIHVLSALTNLFLARRRLLTAE